MDDTTYIMAYPDSQLELAQTKAAQFKQNGYEVHLLNTTKALAVVAAGHPNHLVHDLPQSDWVVVIASNTNAMKI